MNIGNKKTVLYKSHIELNAKLVTFGGYEMPVAYSGGIHSEYFAIRKNVGVFDVSHIAARWHHYVVFAYQSH